MRRHSIGISMIATLVSFVLTARASAAEPANETSSATTANYYRKKLASVTIPWLKWSVKPRDVFDEWQRIVRKNDPTDEGVPITLSPAAKAGIEAFSDEAAQALMDASHPLNLNARNVSAEELLSYLCIRYRLQYDILSSGVWLVPSVHPNARKPSGKLLRKVTRTFVVSPVTLGNVLRECRVAGKSPAQWQRYKSAKITRTQWQHYLWERITRDFEEPAKATLTMTWLRDGHQFKVTGDPQVLNDLAENLGDFDVRARVFPAPAPLNAGEERLLADMEAAANRASQAINIDAQTVGDALKKLGRYFVAPAFENSAPNFKVFADAIASSGPVRYHSENKHPVAALLEILDTFTATLEGRADGTWGIVPRKLRQNASYFIAEYKVRPEMFSAKPPRLETKSKPNQEAKTDGMILCGGVTFSPGYFAMYSPASSMLIVKGTILEHLRVRKLLNENWPKPETTEAKKKQKSAER